MGKQLIAILAVGSLLGSEAASEVDERGPFWMAAPGHNHVEIPESGSGAYSRTILVDSGATAAAATGAIDFLKRLGPTFIIVK